MQRQPYQGCLFFFYFSYQPEQHSKQAFSLFTKSQFFQIINKINTTSATTNISFPAPVLQIRGTFTPNNL